MVSRVSRLSQRCRVVASLFHQGSGLRNRQGARSGTRIGNEPHPLNARCPVRWCDFDTTLVIEMLTLKVLVSMRHDICSYLEVTIDYEYRCCRGMIADIRARISNLLSYGSGPASARKGKRRAEYKG